MDIKSERKKINQLKENKKGQKPSFELKNFFALAGFWYLKMVLLLGQG
jgi:hypothetical protein